MVLLAEELAGPTSYGSLDNEPFVDARQQLKDNLRFLLRAADDNPFAFTVDEGGESWYLPPAFACPATNYVFAGFYGEGGEPYYGLFSEFQPIHDNCFYRNFAFDRNNLDPNGMVNTSVSGGNYYQSDEGYYLPCLTISNYPTNYFDVAGYLIDNQPIPSSQLSSSQTQWILPADEGADSFSAGTIPAQNFYGLPIVSAQCAYIDQNNELAVTTCYPGQPLSSGDGVLYYQVAQPSFSSASYYFARPNYDPVPEQVNFVAPSASPTIVVGVGTSQRIAGYAKFGLQNGNSGVSAWLGQYFASAYEIGANGVATGAKTGILSPYGNFFATQPGPAALITMPDVDTGEQGTCAVYCVSLQLDGNHDGTMDTTFNGTDTTSTNLPYVFWCNNNFDRWATNSVGFGFIYTDIEQDDQQIAFSPAAPTTPTPDCNYSNMLANGFAYRAIPCTRDLEDFARLWVCGITTNLLAQLPSGSTVTLSWGDMGSPSSANPTIDLFTAADADGGIGYQTNETVAIAQINAIQCPYVGRLGPGGSIQLNASQFANSWAGNYFVWCGVSNGTGGLVLTIADGSGNTLAQTTSYIQIVDIKQLYERYTVGDNSAIPPLTTPILASEGLPVGVPSFQYPLPQNTNTPYILHVHGYNMQTWVKDRFAETEFKRLYWQGYQGRFGEFRWPTTVQGLGNLTTAFDDSESNAWQSAKGLLNLLTNLNAKYPGHVYLTAHSHGNVVAGEALRLAGNNEVVNTYIAMQGALASHAYDPTTPIRLLNSTGINLDHGTPDYCANYYTSGAPCYFNGSAGAGTYVNFLNTNDWALTVAWRPDQDLKPNISRGYGWDGTNFYQGLIYHVYQLFPIDTYSIFAYCDPARCQALGAQMNVGGPFLNISGYDQVVLPSVWPPDTVTPAQPYSTHIWHSAEFRSDNPQRWLFWDTALFQMGLKKSL